MLISTPHVTFNTYTKLYNSNVCSILDYASEIWGFVEAKACNQIQNRAIRYILGVHKFCLIPALNGDMGWSYCQDRRLYIYICPNSSQNKWYLDCPLGLGRGFLRILTMKLLF